MVCLPTQQQQDYLGYFLVLMASAPAGLGHCDGDTCQKTMAIVPYALNSWRTVQEVGIQAEVDNDQ